MMRNKILLNVLYNIGILVCLYIAYQTYLIHRYDYMTGAIVVVAIFIYLKMRLLKEVRTMQREFKK